MCATCLIISAAFSEAFSSPHSVEGNPFMKELWIVETGPNIPPAISNLMGPVILPRTFFFLWCWDMQMGENISNPDIISLNYSLTCKATQFLPTPVEGGVWLAQHSHFSWSRGGKKYINWWPGAEHMSSSWVCFSFESVPCVYERQEIPWMTLSSVTTT